MEHFSASSLLLRAGAVAVLLVANAFFVASEFALVAASRARIDTLAASGDRRAGRVRVALDDLYRQLSAAQLGITLASILLGYVAEDTVAVVVQGWLDRLPPALEFLGRAAVASIVAVTVITFLHVVVGEQAPKAWAITHPERTSRWIAAPLMFFAWITSPATNLLNASANRLLRMLGISASTEALDRIHSPEELVMMLRRAQQSGHLDHGDVRMIEGVFEFTEKNVRNVMTHRTEIIALHADVTAAQAAHRVAECGRSRYPVYEESLDQIAGVVDVKQILAALAANASEPIRSLAREPLFVPGTREVEDALADMQRLKVHMAIVLDEYGGTAGLVTLEDLIEEIVGEIYDEYDGSSAPMPAAGAAVTVLPGDAEIAEVNARYGLELRDAFYQTIGGWVFGRLGRLPRRGDAVAEAGVRVEVLETDGRRVAKVRVTRESSG